MLTRDQAKKLTTKVLALSKADEAHVTLSGGSTTHLRFARNSPSTSGTYSNPSVSIRSTFGKRSGSVSVNQFDDSTLAVAVARSETLAKIAPEDRELMPGLGPQQFMEIPHAFSEATATRGAENMAKGVAVCLKDALDKGLVAAGYTQTRAGYSCIANSKGLFGYHKASSAHVSETVRTKDASGSGWASQSTVDIGQLQYPTISATAAAKASTSAKPKPLAPGKYVTILEPACVANLVSMMMWSMNARSADEGRSFFSKKGGGNRRGETLFGKDVTITSDPADKNVPGSPWGGGGLPQQKRAWVQNGVLETLRYDRFWAQKNHVDPIPGPANTIMAGGEGNLDDLIADTKSGVLVTSLWYIRSLDPRTMLFTGLTRDGVFWIENGKISHPVTNFRWNDSPISVLKNIDAMTRSYQVPPRPQRSARTLVPALRVKEFNFSTVSEAV